MNFKKGGFFYRFFTVLLAVFIVNCATAQNSESTRPKVALVLSGGGAKGAAHVGVIKVLEEAGIPIDFVVGTSMGAIIGGLYAYGYSSDQLDSLLRSQDWMSLILNSTRRGKKEFLKREFDERYIVTIPIFRNKSNNFYGGVLSGEAVLELFYTLMPEHTDSMDFNNLEIPFACVAYDVMDNRELVLNKGLLPESIRASMSIPAVFSPVRKDDMLLVDGGMVNNYPADVAKQMGADVIIGVTLNPEGEQKKAADVRTTPDVMLKILDNVTDNKIAENVTITDLLINVDTKGYSAGSFNNDAICELLNRGEMHARMRMDDILELKASMKLDSSVTTQRFQLNVPPKATKIAGAAKPDEKGGTFGAGLRGDNEELAAILLGANYKFNVNYAPQAGAELRLGKRRYIKTNFSIKPFGNYKLFGSGKKAGNFILDGTYKFSLNENKVYRNGERIFDWDYHEHFACLSIYRTWNSFKVTLAADLSYKKFDHLLSTALFSAYRNDVASLNYDSEKSFNYYVSYRFDDRDDHVYPHSGAHWLLHYSYMTDNGRTYGGKSGLNVLQVSFEHNFPLCKRLTFTPSVWGRFTSTPDFYRLGDRNLIGGVGIWGHYLPQQLPFVGINYFEVIDDKFGAAGATFRYRLGKNHFLSAIGNYGRASTYIKDFFSEEELVGYGLGYGYKTPVGPIDFNLNWSNRTSTMGFWIQFGYMF